jgi:ubiquitin carboxyl-terminal hydrolase 16/45
VQFRSYRQQDAQELLRYLLDGVRTEEIARLAPPPRAGKAEPPPPQRKAAAARPRESAQATTAGPTATATAKPGPPPPTFIDVLFGGVLESTVTCHACHSVPTHPPTHLRPRPTAPKGEAD